MIPKKFIPRILCPLWTLVILVLAACGSASAPTPTPPPTPTPIPAPAVAAETNNEAASSGLRMFVIVPEESTASYQVKEEFFELALPKLGIEAGLADVIGSTQEIEGQLQLNLADLSSPIGTNHFTVNLSTLTTDQPNRDNWIRENGPQFNRFPLAEFTATGVEDAPETYTEGDEVQFKLIGDLTIREVTRPVSFDVMAKLDGNTATGIATVPLRMTDFGIDPPSFVNTLTVADEFIIIVEFTAQEQE